MNASKCIFLSCHESRLGFGEKKCESLFVTTYINHYHKLIISHHTRRISRTVCSEMSRWSMWSIILSIKPPPAPCFKHVIYFFYWMDQNWALAWKVSQSDEHRRTTDESQSQDFTFLMCIKIISLCWYESFWAGEIRPKRRAQYWCALISTLEWNEENVLWFY